MEERAIFSRTSMDDLAEAQRLLVEWKGSSYCFGNHVLDYIGEATRAFGEITLIVTNGSPWIQGTLRTIHKSLRAS